MLVDIDTKYGPRKVRVCDHCRTVCIPSGRFCSGYCARAHDLWLENQRQMKKEEQRRAQ